MFWLIILSSMTSLMLVFINEKTLNEWLQLIGLHFLWRVWPDHIFVYV